MAMAYPNTSAWDSAELPKGAAARRGMILARTQELCDRGGVLVAPCVDPTRPSEGPAVLYRPDQLITTDVEALNEALRRAELRVSAKVIREPHSDALPYSLVQIDGADPLDLVHELGMLDFQVAPNHVMTQGQHIFFGPGSDPLPAEPRAMSACDRTEEWPHRVAIIDTGVLEDDATPFSVAGHTVQHLKDFENPDIDGDGVIDHRGGAHGTFIGGILESRVPGIRLRFDDAFERKGSDVPVTDEWSFSVQLAQAVADKDVKLINLSLGTYSLSQIRPGLLEASMRWAIARRPDILFVCAAGNGGRSDRWFPAGFSDQRGFEGRIVSVGALEQLEGGASRVASFSNYGPWVNAWAPGVDLVSYYATGKKFVYFDEDGAPTATRMFDEGFACWSGTSFAAPYAGGDIVRHAIDQTGGDVVKAWNGLYNGIGFVVF